LRMYWVYSSTSTFLLEREEKKKEKEGRKKEEERQLRRCGFSDRRHRFLRFAHKEKGEDGGEEGGERTEEKNKMGGMIIVRRRLGNYFDFVGKKRKKRKGEGGEGEKGKQDGGRGEEVD